MARSGKSTPVLVLSALDSVDERVKGLRAGGDDYLVKPFAYDELHARVRALIRRGPAPSRAARVLHAGTISLDDVRRIVTVDGQEVDLSQREFSLLECLLRHPDQVVADLPHRPRARQRTNGQQRTALQRGRRAGAPCAAAGAYLVLRTSGVASPPPPGRGAVGHIHLMRAPMDSERWRFPLCGCSDHPRFV